MRDQDYQYDAPPSRRFILQVDRNVEFPHYNQDIPVTLRCGLCGWTKQTTRGEFPGLHAKHREEKHASV